MAIAGIIVVFFPVFLRLYLFGLPKSIFYLFIGPSNEIYYPVIAVLRLFLFGVMAVQLALTREAHEKFTWLFTGIVASGVFCALIGLLEFYGLISLNPLRFGTRTSTPGVLHALFTNRAFFGQFVLITIPFIMIGFMSRYRNIWLTMLLFAVRKPDPV